MQVPLIDLKAQYVQIKPEIDIAIQQVLSNGHFIGGENVDDFEEEFTNRNNVKHCISVGNGTDALYIALKALGIKEGDEVITTASSWISTASTILQTEATPVFVDIEQDYYTIDPSLIENKITKRTKAIIPVHLYGQMTDMVAIRSICDRHNLKCIEDSAQAYFAILDDVRPGQLGDMATYSFYPTKNLGAYGDAGCIVTNDDDLAQKCSELTNYGHIKLNNKITLGGNSRLDTLQAAILNVKLKYVDTWIEQRIKHVKTYNRLLKNVNQIITPKVRQGSRHTYYTYVVRCQNRDRLKKYLLDKGITTAVHYPMILPLLHAFSFLNHQPEDFPIALQCQQEVLSLPIYAELTNIQIEYVVNCIRDFYN